MTTLMRPYLELEKAVAEAMGWTEVSIVDMEMPNWNTAWHNQTVLYGCPPKYEHHPPKFLVPRFIYEGKVMDLIHLDEFEINISWYTDSVGVADSFERVFSEAVEKFNDHPNKQVALHTALCKMILAIKRRTNGRT